MRPLALALALPLLACGQDQARREEAGRMVEHIDTLIMMDRREKAAALQRLQNAPCTLPDVCEARRACGEAFAPVVEAARLQLEARALLDQHDPALSAQIDARLDEAEKKQAQARKLQDTCISATTQLRQAYRL
jgi:hypothetical protein